MPTHPREYVLRWLRRKGSCTLREATQQGIERQVLDALVVDGDLTRTNGPNPTYKVVPQEKRRAGELGTTKTSRLEIIPDDKLRDLSSDEEYLVRWLDRVGRISLWKAQRAGVSSVILDSLVAHGRARVVTGSETVYESTAPAPTDLSTVDPARFEKPKLERPALASPSGKLSQAEERTARWLRRTGKRSVSHAASQGVERAQLDALVEKGYAEHPEGDQNIYRALDFGARISRGAEARPREDIKPIPPSLDQRIVDLLSDGKTRSPAEIASALLEGNENFIAQRQIAREVQNGLPQLVSRGYLQRIMFGVPVATGSLRTYRYEEGYVGAAAVIPVCSSCFQKHWGVDSVPPQATGNAIQLCAFPDCRRRTNDAAYVPRTELEERLLGATLSDLTSS